VHLQYQIQAACIQDGKCTDPSNLGESFSPALAPHVEQVHLVYNYY
jgi:hypothetical protein